VVLDHDHLEAVREHAALEDLLEVRALRGQQAGDDARRGERQRGESVPRAGK
jgi:hypothetical protein